jgi:hypothetical protein
VIYSQLTDPLKEEARSELEELILWFIWETGHIPEGDDIKWIIQTFREEFSESVSSSEEVGLELITDDGVISLFNDILERNADFCSQGVNKQSK